MGSRRGLQGIAAGTGQCHIGQRRHGLAQFQRQAAQARLRRAERIRLLRVGINDEADGAGEIIKHQHFFGHHQQDVRVTQLIRRRRGAQPWLYITYRVVAEIPYQAAVEHRQVLVWGTVVARLKGFDEREWVCHLGLLHHLAVHQHFYLAAKHAQQRAARQANDGVTAPFLPTLYGLEKVGEGALTQLAVGTDGGFQVGKHFYTHRDPVIALRSQRGKVLNIHAGRFTCARAARISAIATG